MFGDITEGVTTQCMVSTILIHTESCADPQQLSFEQRNCRPAVSQRSTLVNWDMK